MDNNRVGKIIQSKRKAVGLTQQSLADKLNISFQAVSKWENGMAYPDIELLPQIANILSTSVDALLGYSSISTTEYEEIYKAGDYYWGLNPNRLCYEIMKLRPPVKPYRVLDIGCGEGKDAIFLAKNGYIVTAFDIAEAGIEKARKLSERNNVYVDFFKANVMDYRPDSDFDIIFSSGVFHYVMPEIRDDFVNSLKVHTKEGGINAINVFVDKPFLKEHSNTNMSENKKRWYSGELFTYYHDWLFHKIDEELFDCNSGGIPHKHCMDILIAEKL